MGRHVNTFLGVVRPKFDTRLVEKFYEGSKIRDFIEAVRNSSKMVGVGMLAILSIEVQRSIVRDIHGSHCEGENEVDNADEDCDFERMVFIDVAATSGVCDRLKKIQSRKNFGKMREKRCRHLSLR